MNNNQYILILIYIYIYVFPIGIPYCILSLFLSLYIYIFMYWRLEGKKRQLPPIGKSVSVSFRVRVVRACVHAKLCGCVRQVFPMLGARMERFSATPARVVAFHFLMLYAWVLNEMH